MHGACLCRGVFGKRTCGSDSWDSDRDLRELLQLEEEFRMILIPRGCAEPAKAGGAPLVKWYQSRIFPVYCRKRKRKEEC
jgi:hypothetical protein